MNNSSSIAHCPHTLTVAWAKLGQPLWVTPQDISQVLFATLNYHWSVQLELSEWFARRFSHAYLAGLRNTAAPRVEPQSVYRMLVRMGYDAMNAHELMTYLIAHLPGCYRKGLSHSPMRTLH